MWKVITVLSLLFAAQAASANRLHCRFDPTGAPMTYLQYHPKKKVLHVWWGWVKTKKGQGPMYRKYTGVQWVKTEPAWQDLDWMEKATGYRHPRSALIGFGGDVVMLHLIRSNNGTNWYERDTKYPYQVTWGDPRVPGAPTRHSKIGVCWTDRAQPQINHR